MAARTTPLTPEQLHILLNGPAEKPPVGVLPNFDDASNLDDFLILTLTLCVAFATLMFLLRLYTKAFLIRSMAYEDYVIVIAWIGQIAETIPSGFCTRHGGGSHMWNVRLKTFFEMLYWVNISAIVYCPVIFLVKLSILLQCLRIFVPTRKGNMSMFIGCHVCIWSCFILYLVDMVFEIFMCNPREKIWNPLLPGHCFNNNASFLATGIFNVISDFAILILPMPALWRLQIPMKTKIMMIAVFATGFLACVTSILRTYYSWKIYKSEDVSYNMIIMGFWTYAEIAIGITVSCLPVIPRFFHHFGPKLRTLAISRYKSSATSRSKSASTGYTPKIKTAPKLSDTSTKRSRTAAADPWDNSGHSTNPVKDNYITLDDYDERPIVPPKSYNASQITASYSDGAARMRDDVERGHADIS